MENVCLTSQRAARMNHSCREILDTFCSDSLSVLLQLRFFYAGSSSLDKPGQCSVSRSPVRCKSTQQGSGDQDSEASNLRVAAKGLKSQAARLPGEGLYTLRGSSPRLPGSPERLYTLIPKGVWPKVSSPRRPPA